MDGQQNMVFILAGAITLALVIFAVQILIT